MSLSGGPLDPGDTVHLRSGGSRRAGETGALRSTAVAFASTVLLFGFVGWIIVNAPGWPAVQESFLNGRVFAETFGFIKGSFVWERSILRAFLVNVQLFLIAEVLILGLGLVLAVLRSLPGPVLFPLRAFATVYADIFRALPGILVIYLLGFGIPGLGIAGVPVDPFIWAVVALTLIYSAYVSEVYRAGIDSVHPSQGAAARSLGLTQFQALRHVVLPQAVRRVIPPLLNDFIGLQKDTVLVSYVGVVEIFRQSQIKQAATFNFTPYVATALVFIVMTIPLARLTDWLVARDRGRAAASAR
ncbi:MAG TPA: amino acid ABC transporter permease [Candidatus Nanopelagicales bacterium]|nr:amino acid ABC transporter permease [Candidatus Nanopelagicales bacterium]